MKLDCGDFVTTPRQLLGFPSASRCGVRKEGVGAAFKGESGRLRSGDGDSTMREKGSRKKMKVIG